MAELYSTEAFMSFAHDVLASYKGTPRNQSPYDVTVGISLRYDPPSDVLAPPTYSEGRTFDPLQTHIEGPTNHLFFIFLWQQAVNTGLNMLLSTNVVMASSLYLCPATG